MRNPFSRRPVIVHSNLAQVPSGAPVMEVPMAFHGTDWKIEDFFAPGNAEALRNLVVRCANEYSAENIVAYGAVVAFKRAPSMPKALYIYNTFVHPRAAYNVNLQGVTLAPLTQAFAAAFAPRAQGGRHRHVQQTVAPVIFDAMLIDLAVNLSDTLARMQTESRVVGNTAYFKRYNDMAGLDVARPMISSLVANGFPVPPGMQTA